ncbi:MAG: type 1 periplasmic binding fold superfamily protein [Vicingaceae bacterium]|nr:type 1 periplasmic binding fold superfamily protein [Vicingaceae bacterium]
MSRIKTYSILAVIALTTVMVGCSKDDDTPEPATTPSGTTTPPNEEELITSAILNFVDTAGVQPSVQVAFRDPDGDGGNAPTEHDTIRLVANTYYTATIQLLNESESPAEDITLEVQQEDDEHLFCYTPSNTNVAITRTDSDGTYEVGIATFWSTGASATGETTVTLKHQPDVKDGTCAPGDTDIEISFVTEIQ